MCNGITTADVRVILREVEAGSRSTDMRGPWLTVLFLILLPVILLFSKLLSGFGSTDSNSLMNRWIPALVVVVATVVVFFLLRLMNRHRGNHHRH